MNRMLKQMLVVALLLGTTSSALSLSPNDLDGDGRPDQLSASPVIVAADGTSSLQLVVRLSTQRSPLRVRLASQTPSLQAYIGDGALIVDRAEHSRDAAELRYAVYRWNAGSKHLCLHVDVTGIPPNQLQGEWLPRDVEVSRYAPCAVLGQGGHASPLASTLARQLALTEAGKLQKSDPVPDYLAFELAAQVDETTVTFINDIGYYQEQAGFLRQALVILAAVNDRFPRRAVAQLNLADTYWKLGDRGRACQLYRNYLVSASQKGGAARQRAVDRSACQQ